MILKKREKAQGNIIVITVTILLVIVGVAIIYNVVNPLISERSGEILSSTDEIQLRNALTADIVSQTENTLIVSVERISPVLGCFSKMSYTFETNDSICYVQQNGSVPVLETKEFVVDVSSCLGEILSVDVEPILGECVPSELLYSVTRNVLSGSVANTITLEITNNDPTGEGILMIVERFPEGTSMIYSSLLPDYSMVKPNFRSIQNAVWIFDHSTGIPSSITYGVGIYPGNSSITGKWASINLQQEGVVLDGSISPDLDSDGVKDSEDSALNDPWICSDVDNDGCDDCSNIGWRLPRSDGEDLNEDGICSLNQDETDADGDGAIIGLDSDDNNRFVCSDVDNDGCDDCYFGHYNPFDDGWDENLNGICDSGE
jgi:hypothetical protein